MKIAFMVIENRCNLDCPYCFYVQRGDKWTKDWMDLSTVQSVLDQLIPLGFTGVVFTGGEPTLHPNLLDCIAHAKARGYTVWLATNGTLLTDKLATSLKEKSLDFIYLSTNTVTPTDKAIAFLEKSIATLRRAGLNAIHLTWVISKPDPALIRRVHAFARGQNVDVVFQPAWLVRPGKLLQPVTKGDMLRIAPPLIEWAKDMHHIPYVKTIFRHYRDGEKPESCTMGSSRIIIDWNGDVYPCFHRRDLKAGNVLVDSCEHLLSNLQERAVPQIANASCFGEHCISLFA